MHVFYCESGRAVKRGRDEVTIKDNTHDEYESSPVVTPCSLLFVQA